MTSRLAARSTFALAFEDAVDEAEERRGSFSCERIEEEEEEAMVGVEVG